MKGFAVFRLVCDKPGPQLLQSYNRIIALMIFLEILRELLM